MIIIWVITFTMIVVFSALAGNAIEKRQYAAAGSFIGVVIANTVSLFWLTYQTNVAT